MIEVTGMQRSKKIFVTLGKREDLVIEKGNTRLQLVENVI
jgi:hypothetical protein